MKTPKLRVNPGESSTQRGLVLFITGAVVLYHTFFGGDAAPDMEAILSRTEFWVGLGMQLSGLLGVFTPDNPKTVEIRLPPVELQSRSQFDEDDDYMGLDTLKHGLRNDVSSESHPSHISGFNDQ